MAPQKALESIGKTLSVQYERPVIKFSWIPLWKSVDPPDVIKISPCARMECWIDPFSMAPQKALESIGKTLSVQYERWQPRARYKVQLDPTVEEVKKLCSTCRKYAKTERVLFHYNGHGVPKPTASGEIWLFNKSYTQYIPLPISDLDSWLKTPSIYVFDCSAAGMIVNAFTELHDPSGLTRDCILLAACESHETLPQRAEFPADVFTSCLTTPIKMALRWLFELGCYSSGRGMSSPCCIWCLFPILIIV
ncbi:regulatory-associated protein of TOR 1-like isoform X2 [Cucumis melo]|nr:regulatory-associated protein of TOR 1-like isoform X2 [Cucumis melo]